MKKTLLHAMLLLSLPVPMLAQYGGGDGKGESYNSVQTIQLNGVAVNLYTGGNGRGEITSSANSAQLNGIALSVYGGGDGRGEISTTISTNQLDGTSPGIYSGGDGRGETLNAINTQQLNGSITGMYAGGNGRGENISTVNTNQLDGSRLLIYSGGNGRGEILSAQNSLQLDGIAADLYKGGNGRGETVLQLNVTTLPVTLMSFSAALEGEQVKLQWQTASEIHTASFAVERSLDGVQWQAIGTKKAAGTSSLPLSYSLFDVHPVEGINYYRLKSIDVDGKFTYSSIATVHFHLRSGWQISLYPNPVKFQFTVLISGLRASAQIHIRMLNAAGQIVLEKQNLRGNAQTIDISALSLGVYYLMVYNGSEVTTAKVVKE